MGSSAAKIPLFNLSFSVIHLSTQALVERAQKYLLENPCKTTSDCKEILEISNLH